MNRNLLAASEALGWPRKVVYEDVPLEARRSFERAFQDLLYLQLECVAFLIRYDLKQILTCDAEKNLSKKLALPATHNGRLEWAYIPCKPWCARLN